MSKLVTKKHPYADILKGSMAQAQNKNKKNPTHEKFLYYNHTKTTRKYRK
jgi:hypothetical protein